MSATSIALADQKGGGGASIKIEGSRKGILPKPIQIVEPEQITLSPRHSYGEASGNEHSVVQPERGIVHYNVSHD